MVYFQATGTVGSQDIDIYDGPPDALRATGLITNSNHARARVVQGRTYHVAIISAPFTSNMGLFGRGRTSRSDGHFGHQAATTSSRMRSH